MRGTISFCLVILSYTTTLAADVPDFERSIVPIFSAHCISCHGPDKQRGGLRLDRKIDGLRGGDDGPVIIAGKSRDSNLIKRLHSREESEQMPPKGDRLSAEQIRTIASWIDAGATWPDDRATTDEMGHWAFKPLARPTPPIVRDVTNSMNPIDSFILAGLKTRSLQPSPPTDRVTLIRRLKFDLLGIPPTPEEIAAFAADQSPSAYEKIVDRYLADPGYGERQARHWLDVVRFAESHGFEMNNPRPNAWVYRDWVIHAFQKDMPYDQFVRQQLAGDSLAADAATGFLVAGPWDQVKSPDVVLTAQQRADELHDIVATTSSAFLGLTVGCARCHAHKFDPIPQSDYYAMKAVFSGVQHGERPLPNSGEERIADAEIVLASRPGDPIPTIRRTPIQTGRNVDRFVPTTAKYVRFSITAANSAEPCIDEFEVFTAVEKPVNLARQPAVIVTASSSMNGNPIHQLKHIHDGQYGNSHSWISNEIGKGTLTVEFPEPMLIDRVIWSRDRTTPPMFFDRLATAYHIEISTDGKTWSKVASSADRAMMTSRKMGYIGVMGTPQETRMFKRGEVTQPGEMIAPGSLTRVSKPLQIPINSSDSQRRLALANWIVQPAHPLTSRVMVNRIWQSHFGVGIVETPSDFGRNGGKPSHPELLDWLASEFVESGWKMKHIHRLIVTSATYRQASQIRPDGMSIDAGDRLLWRYPARRLEAEAIRDSILAVTGNLDTKMGGPGFDLFEPNGNYVKVYNPRKTFGPETFRRMVYWSKPRMQLDDTFGSFDCPDAGQIAPKRNISTTPLQALNLLNSPFTIQQSDAFAARLTRESADASQRINRAFLLAFGRQPSESEAIAASKLVREYGLSALCRALLNANEFLFIR